MGRKALMEEIRGKDSRELRYELGELRKELFEIRMQLTSDATKASGVRDIRRKIARILTVLREREAADAGKTAERDGAEG